jgi:S1-C subfamily serine protease
LALLVVAEAQAAESESRSIEAAAAKVSRSVVRISIRERDEELGNGSGFFIADGVIVTNHHVIDHAPRDTVAVLGDGSKLKVLGVLADDAVHDLAILRVDGNAPALVLADSAEIRNAIRVIAVGSPLGFDQSVSSGIVSALRADYPEEWRKRDPDLKKRSGPLVQHTAAIAPGSSGSPLVDDDGRVVGVNHSGFVGNQVNFAAHVDALRELVGKTDLHAKPQALGPSTTGNLLISLGVLPLLAAFAYFTTRKSPRRQRPIPLR